MTDASRRVYLGLGRAFVAIGGVVVLGSLLDRLLGWGFFRGSPLGTAAFLVVIGVLLLWTVRQADARHAPTAADDGAADASAPADDDAEEAGAPVGESPDKSPKRP